MFQRFIHTSGNPLLTGLRLTLGIVFLANAAPPVTVLEIASQFFGGIALLLGVLTRLAAFGIALDLVLALTTAHLPFHSLVNGSDPAMWGGFEYRILLFAVAAALIVRGAGACSVDRLLAHEPPASRSASLATTQQLESATTPFVVVESATDLSPGSSTRARFIDSAVA